MRLRSSGGPETGSTSTSNSRRDERIRILRYERTCDHTQDVVESLSGYLGITLPTGKIVSKTRAQSRSERDSGLHPDVERLCRELWDSFAGLPEL